MHNAHIVTACVGKGVNSLNVQINYQRTVQIPRGENTEAYEYDYRQQDVVSLCIVLKPWNPKNPRYVVKKQLEIHFFPTFEIQLHICHIKDKIRTPIRRSFSYDIHR